MNTKKLFFALSLLTLSSQSSILHAGEFEDNLSLSSDQVEQIESLIDNAILFVVKETTQSGFAGGFGSLQAPIKSDFENSDLWKAIEQNLTVKNSLNALKVNKYNELVYYIYNHVKNSNGPIR